MTPGHEKHEDAPNTHLSDEKLVLRMQHLAAESPEYKDQYEILYDHNHLFWEHMTKIILSSTHYKHEWEDALQDFYSKKLDYVISKYEEGHQAKFKTFSTGCLRNYLYTWLIIQDKAILQPHLRECCNEEADPFDSVPSNEPETDKLVFMLDLLFGVIKAVNAIKGPVAKMSKRKMIYHIEFIGERGYDIKDVQERFKPFNGTKYNDTRESVGMEYYVRWFSPYNAYRQCMDSLEIPEGVFFIPCETKQDKDRIYDEKRAVTKFLASIYPKFIKQGW